MIRAEIDALVAEAVGSHAHYGRMGEEPCVALGCRLTAALAACVVERDAADETAASGRARAEASDAAYRAVLADNARLREQVSGNPGQLDHARAVMREVAERTQEYADWLSEMDGNIVSPESLSILAARLRAEAGEKPPC